MGCKINLLMGNTASPRRKGSEQNSNQQEKLNTDVYFLRLYLFVQWWIIPGDLKSFLDLQSKTCICPIYYRKGFKIRKFFAPTIRL